MKMIKQIKHGSLTISIQDCKIS
ncbi:DUF2292 domain-containing protein [Ruminiclostridium hungatei]